MSLTDLPNQKIASLDFLSGGGEMGERIRNFDWSRTSIGSPDHWEQSLKTCVRIMLTSPQPMFVWWGKDLVNIYNDAYGFVLGEKHPQALGASGKQVWKEIWNEVGQLADIVFNKNEGTYNDALLLIMNRFGYDEETYFKFSYNPIPGDKGGTSGLFCACTEETKRFINERSLKTLQELDVLAHEKTEEGIYQQAAKILSANNKDFPFGIIYRIHEIEKSAKPISYFGISQDQTVFPLSIDLAKPQEGTYNFCEAYQTKGIIVSENAGRRKKIPTGAWKKEATHFIHIPVFLAGYQNPVAILSAALNPYRKFDEEYEQFAQLIADKIALEISKVKSYEQERRRAESLAELDKAKTIFFSNISHEFRTPLTLMLGNIEEALNEPESVPKNFERMNMTHRNAMRLLKLVNTLLDFSRIESGRQKASYALTDIVNLTKNLAGNFRSIIENAGLKFLVKADAIIQPVYIDKLMWEKIVFNLLSNAFKYTLKGSITLRLYHNKKNVVLEVEDTGTGIPEKELPHVFERFHRVENVAGRTYEGTGIGLSLTKELVSLHGGNISVKSKEGTGTTFIVSIPFGKEHLPAEQTTDASEHLEDIISDVYIEEASSLLERHSQPSGIKNKEAHLTTILVVDDNADMRNHISSLLEKEYNVVTAVNGMDALHKVKDERPALIVSDIMMPIMDGIQLLKEIKSDPVTENIPLVLLTARAGEESKIEGYETGADDYLVKPFAAKELKARIRAQINIKEKRDKATQGIYNLFDDVPFAVAVLKGKELVVDYINKYSLQIWGQKREDVLGRPLFKARPELKESVGEVHNEIFRTGKRFNGKEVPLTINHNGTIETRYFDAIIDPMFDEHGRMIGQMSTSIEVTEQVMARKKIEESEQELQALLKQAPVFFMLFEGEDLVVKVANNTALQLLRKTQEDVLNKPIFEYLPELSERKQIYLDVLHSQKPFSANEVPISFMQNGKIHEGFYNLNYMPWYSIDGKVKGVMSTGIEVTEQVVARKKITESEEKNRLFIEHAPAAMAMFDKEMRYVSASKRWMMEYDLTGNIIGQKHYELFPNILERWKEVHSRGMSGAVERSDEDFYVKDDGTPVWLKWEVHPWYETTGEIGGIVIFTENITERKNDEQAIRESEVRYRHLIENLSVAIYTCDKDGNIILYNEKAVEIWGRKPVAGKDKWIAFHKLYVDGKLTASEDSPMAIVVKQGKLVDVKEVQIEKPDGSTYTIIPYPRPVFNSDGEVTGGVNILIDITERKKIEQALHQSEERFRTMANEAPLFVWVTDEKLQTTYLNKAGLDFFDLDESAKMAELSWKKYIHPDDIENVLSTMKDAASTHESYILEMRLKNGASGKYHWFLDKGAPRYNNDEFVGFIGTSLDINERKEIEKELEQKVQERTRELAGQNILLQKQNDLVKKIFDTSVDAIGVYDTELRIVTLNQASLDIFGGKEEEVIGKKLLEFLPQMEGTKGHLDLLKAIGGETIHNKIYHSEVSNRYYENFLMPLKDEKGKVYAVLVIAHDNTDLISSTEKLKVAQQIAQIGHWEWELTNGRLTWSDNMYRIYGLSPADGISFAKFIDRLHPEDKENVQVNIEHALQTKTFNDFFHRIITPDGEEKIMHARGEMISDKKGNVLRIVGTGQDVTKQKTIEKELMSINKNVEERNQFIEQLINSSLDLIVVIDKDLRLITINKKAQAIYSEFYKEDILGKKITEIDPPVKGTESFEDIQQAFAGKVIVKDKIKSTLSDKYFEHNYVPLMSVYGEVYAVMIISHDITEKTKQMEELRKLYESDAQKNNFIAMASHELKTPITSIKGYVQLLLNAVEKEKEQHKPLPPLLVRSSLLSVDKQISRLTRLISELLDLSKIETGTLELKKEKFSINELAIETVQDVLYTNTNHEINLYHDFRSYVFGDKDRIGQVMINFLTNAIKYSPNCNKIDVTIRKTRNNQVAFSVRDYGIGIDKEDQEKIFERFYRAKGKEEQTYPGFGIGLFIAKEFVVKNGGQVLVESEKGSGSVFTFTLPIFK